MNDLFGGASRASHGMDLLFLVILVGIAAFSAGIGGVVLAACARLRLPGGGEHHDWAPTRGFWVTACAASLAFVLVLFFWSTRALAAHRALPADRIEVSGSARRWLWTFRHEEGPTEINALHVPVGVPVRLRMRSEDVVHGLSIPAFRLRQDVVPEKETAVWFRATRPGIYPLSCTEYCGMGHSQMAGAVYVLDPIEYEHWVTGDQANMTPEQAGELLFRAFRCESCHLPAGGGTGPPLAGKFGEDVQLADGSAVPFDADYVRESLLEPAARLVEGYQPVMPSYRGQLDESQIAAITAYLESLGK